MAKIIAIIGLPASGKTTLAQKFVEDGFILIDDPRSIIKSDDFWFCENRLGEVIKINNQNNYVICDPWLCDPKNRDSFKKQFKDFEIEEIFFENNIDKCRINDNFRDRQRRTRKWNFNYEIPEGAQIFSIYKRA